MKFFLFMIQLSLITFQCNFMLSPKCKLELNCIAIFFLRDLLDLSKDNIQIKESRAQGILLSGVSEVIIFLTKWSMSKKCVCVCLCIKVM